MLSNHTKEFRNASYVQNIFFSIPSSYNLLLSTDIIRSRDPNVLSTADIIVDVGAEFDVEANKFDHHQCSFNEQFSKDFETKLSSAGLIYKYFGKEILKDIIINHKDDIKTTMDKNENKVENVDDETIEILYKKVYESFIEGIDGIDNGIKQYDTDKEKRYKVNTDLSARVGSFNPWWNQETNDEIAMIQFKKAMECVGKELIESVLFIYKGWLPAREIVADSIKNRFEIHKSGQILKLNQFCPWIEHFYEIHEQTPIDPLPIYTLFQDTKGGWRIRAVPKEVGSFDNIKPLPDIWCGKRNDELDEICGVKDCVFIHASGFIGGNKTYEGALAMADKALEYKSEDNTQPK